MNWFFIALLTPILFAFVVHLDKYLITRFNRSNHKSEKGIGALILYSSLFGLIISCVLFSFFRLSVFTIPVTDIGILFLSGICGVFAVILYLYAMEKDEASIVASLFQIVPIFGLVFEYLILGIIPTIVQICGSLLIITAGLLLVTELKGYKIKKIKVDILILMTASSLLFALISILFKFSTIENGSFWISSFWEYLAWGVTGLTLFTTVKSYRIDFLRSLRNDGRAMFGANMGGEFASTVANSAKNFAALLVPVTLVYSVEALQPIFILLFGILITIFIPKMSKEDISKAALIQKGFPILVMIIGTIIILV